MEYAYAKQNNLAYTKLISADGEAVSPTGESFSAAAKKVDWSKSFAQDLTNRDGANAWYNHIDNFYFSTQRAS